MNSPIESYNNLIKSCFTKRIKHHLKSSLEVFKELASYESVNVKNYSTEAKLRTYMQKQASSILKANRLEVIGESKFEYSSSDGSICKIDSLNKVCSCSKFLSVAIF